MEGKNSFYNSLQASSDLNTALDSCADNLLKTSLDDFALPPVPKKDLLSSLNNNVDYFNPNFTNCTSVLQSRMTVADCHTPPPADCRATAVSSTDNSKISSYIPSGSLNVPFSNSESAKLLYNSPQPPAQPSPGHSFTPPEGPGPPDRIDPTPLPIPQCQLSSPQQSPAKLLNSSFSCDTPVSLLSHFEEPKTIQTAFPVTPQYISL